MKTKFTPPPWFVDGKEIHTMHGTWRFHQSITIMKGFQGKPEAPVSEAEIIETANLISFAPTMLQLIRDLVISATLPMPILRVQVEKARELLKLFEEKA